MESVLRIGELAARSGVTRKAIRFYEAARVLPPPARGPNGYRLYRSEAVGLLQFVKQAAGLGLTLAEIRDIIGIRQGGRPPCAHVQGLLQEKAVELDHKLKDLLDVRSRVRQSLAAWKRAPATNAAVCPHIEARMSRGRSRRRSGA